MLENQISRESDKKMKRLEKLLEDEISEMGKYVKLKLSFGIDIFSVQLPDTTIELKKIILYILNKSQRTSTDNIILRQYLISYPEFIDTLKLRDQITDPKELLLKISQNLKKEEMFQDRVVFYNGQYGKSFYLILEGEVSVLLPYEFKLKLTDKQVIKYMHYLLQHKEYELIRLMFENNKHIFNDIDYRENTLYQKLKSYSERGLPSNVDIEKISAYDYLQRFEYFSKVERRQKELAMKAEQKEQTEKNEQKDKNKVKTNYFEFFLRENLRRKTGYVKRADTKTIENDEDDEEVIKNKNFFYEEEETFSIYKYFEVIKLSKGKCFGELALTKEGKKRNATIITTKNCIFGTLYKDAYQAFIKETMEKARKSNVEHLLKCGLFRGCNSEKFETHFFNYFKLMKKRKGEYLFKQGDKRDFIYFLKKGEIQLELFSNCYYLDTIMNNLGYADDSFDTRELFKSKKLEQFCKINRKFKILILSDEVIGLEEHTIYPDNLEFAFTGLCASYCEMFALDVKFFNKIMDEKIIRNNYIQLVKERKMRLAERIFHLKNNVIMQQYNFIKDNEKYNNYNNNKNTINKGHKIKINMKLQNIENNKFKPNVNERYNNKNKTRIIKETDKKNSELKTLDNNTNYPKSIIPYGQKRHKTRGKESPSSPSKNNLDFHISQRSSSIRLNRFKILESPKRKLKLKEQKINIQTENIFINRMKKNNKTNRFTSTYSQKFVKNSSALPILPQNLNSEKERGRESINRLSLQTENLIPKDDIQNSSDKNLKLKKNIKYVNFRNIKIPKILLRQSNIFNAEIDKINEIIINNYEKVTPSTYKKSKKKTQTLSINVPEFNSEENKNKLYISNTLTNNFKKKFFPLPLVKNESQNINFESLDEDDIINYFEKK